MKPFVSVIIPNYNHARFLKKRLESIFNQTFQEFEVILLDDCSTDNSLAIIESYRGHPKVSCILLNEHNSGSTFKQWRKGIEAARGSVIWIAESDDYADPGFLEQLVAQLRSSPGAGIAYCQSWSVDENDRATGIWSYTHASRLNPFFMNDFVEDGSAFICSKMSLLNAIPNASAVLFRKEIYLAAAGEENTFRLAGDWLLWIKMLQLSDVAFVAMPLNYFRSHPKNVRLLSEKSGLSLEETCRILGYIARNIDLSPVEFNRMIWHFIDLWEAHVLKFRIPRQSSVRVYQELIKIDPTLNRRILKRFWRSPAGMMKAGLRLI